MDTIGSAYYKNKPQKVEVYTFKELKEEIENSKKDVPLIIDIRDNLYSTYSETESYIDIIDELLNRLDAAANKKIYFNREKSKIDLLENLNKIYNKLIDEFSLGYEEIDFTDVSKKDEIMSKLKNLKSDVTFKLSPIDLTGRTETLFIKGNKNSINGIKIEKAYNAALFTNVGCDIAINDLLINKLIIRGNDITSLISGNNEEINITLNNVIVDAKLYANNKVSELITNAKGNLKTKNVAIKAFMNGQHFLKKLPSEKFPTNMLIEDFILDTCEFVRVEEKEDKVYVRTKK